MLDQNPNDIPKEELLHLCMKLNKRMQTMETKGKELLKKKNTLQAERDKLVRLLEEAMGCTLLAAPDSELDLGVVEEKWNATLAKTLSARLNAEPGDSSVVSEPLGAEALPSTTVDAASDGRLKALEAQLSAKHTETDKLVKQLEEVKLHEEEQIVFFQMQLQSAKQKEEALASEIKGLQAKIAQQAKFLEEKDITVHSNKEMLQALQTRLIELEPELAQSKDKVSTLQILKMEQDNLIKSLRQDLKLSLEEREALVKKNRELEENKIKNDGNSMKVAALTEQVAKLTEDLENSNILLQRLRADATTNERNHAMRTAMLATAEAQVETLQSDLAKKNLHVNELVEKITSLQVHASSLEHTLSEKVSHYVNQIALLEAEMVKLHSEHSDEVRRLKATYEDQIEGIKKDYSKKSTMARTILSEREEEVRILSQKIAQLQEEINSGAPTERKIFEIAHLQSKRDLYNEQYKDSREVSFQKLQQVLAAKDLELAQAQQTYSSLYNELQELRRVKQREGVNMDYLKNIVLQYMTFPLQSNERLSLVAVISTLLQFSPKELSEALAATRNPVYAALPVKEVKRIAPSGVSTVSKVGHPSAANGLQAKRSTNGTTHQPSPRAARVLTADEADFQEKLNKISGDILSMTASYEEVEESV